MRNSMKALAIQTRHSIISKYFYRYIDPTRRVQYTKSVAFEPSGAWKISNDLFGGVVSTAGEKQCQKTCYTNWRPTPNLNSWRNPSWSGKALSSKLSTLCTTHFSLLKVTLTSTHRLILDTYLCIWLFPISCNSLQLLWLRVGNSCESRERYSRKSTLPGKQLLVHQMTWTSRAPSFQVSASWSRIWWQLPSSLMVLTVNDRESKEVTKTWTWMEAWTKIIRFSVELPKNPLSPVNEVRNMPRHRKSSTMNFWV